MRLLIALGFMLLTAACVSAPQHSLRTEQVLNFKLVGVTFRGEENIVSWPSEEANYLKQPGTDPAIANRFLVNSDSNLPEVHPFFAKRLEARLGPNFQSAAGSVLNGSRPVKAIVTIRTLSIPSTGARIFGGGGSSFAATVALVDAKTAEELLVYDGASSYQWNPGGLAAVAASAAAFDAQQENDLFADYFVKYRKWLLKE